MISRRTVLLAFVAACCATATDAEAGRAPKEPAPSRRVTIAREPASRSGGRLRFEVAGLGERALAALSKAELSTEAWNGILAVSVASDSASDPIPMFGAHRVEKQTLVFVPQFPLRPGLTYRAAFDPSAIPNGAGESIEAVSREFSIPKAAPSPPAVVSRVYPSAKTLPENLLKFYIHFSAPMSRGEAYEHIRLVESSGREIEFPFLELGEELWDDTGTRFTLFFDPGRIKRGLKPREEVGPALEEGKSYTLLIDRKWSDAQGRPMKESFRKSFKVGPPDDAQPDPKNWTISAPPAGTTAPLVVHLGEPLDRAMLERVLVVVDPAGKAAGGRVEVEEEETRWRFRPEQAWRAGKHSLVVATTLEDLAGNSIGRPFEVDVVVPIEKRVIPETVSLPFVVAGH